MNYFDYFLQKSRKALAEYSASAFLAGTKAGSFVDCLPGRYKGKRQIDEHSASAFVPARKANNERSANIRRVPS